MESFDLSNYLGTWYELAHYPNWFQPNDSYNTKAEYGVMDDGMICVRNSTIIKGQLFESIGYAKYLGNLNFRVDFSPPEISKLVQSKQFQLPTNTSTGPNYVITSLWTDKDGDYIFAVVSDPSRQSLYVLSRFKHPSLEDYNTVMQYVATYFDRNRLVQTPHFD